MIDTSTEVTRRLSALIGLEVSWVGHAVDMLTMQFGPQKPFSSRRGRVLEGGSWALHVQCNWRIEEAGNIIATRSDLSGPDEKAHGTARRLMDLFVTTEPATVLSISADDAGGFVVSFSGQLQLTVIPDGIAGDEDWRFFAPRDDSAHLIIEGGTVAPVPFD